MPPRSLSLDTGLDSNEADTATDVVSSCEQYLRLQQSGAQFGAERPPRRRLSSIPCEATGPIVEEPNAEDENLTSRNVYRRGESLDSKEELNRKSYRRSESLDNREDFHPPTISSLSSTGSSRRSSTVSLEGLERKPSFVNKCMTRVRGLIKK